MKSNRSRGQRHLELTVGTHFLGEMDYFTLLLLPGFAIQQTKVYRDERK